MRTITCVAVLALARAALAEPVPAPSAPIVIDAVGDLMLGSTYPDSAGGALPPDDGAHLLAAVTPLLSAADLAFGNLEGPLFDGGNSPHCSPGGISEKSRGRPGGTACWAFRMPERYGKLLAAAGFDVLSLANNHIDDFAEPGHRATEQALGAVGIAYSGRTGSVAHLTVRGHALDVIAFAPSYPGLNDMDDLAAARALVAASKASHHLVLVSFHGGAEGAGAQRVPRTAETFYGEGRGAVRQFAHEMVQAGADLVVGSGPHVVRGMEVFQGRLIAYSLGTFATHRGINVAGVLGQTLILEVHLAPDGTFLGGRVHAVRQRSPGGPALDPTRAVVSVLRRLSKLDFGAGAPALAADGTLSP